MTQALAFQPGELTLASGGDDGTVTFWDMVAGEPSSGIGAHDRPVIALAFSPDGVRLATVAEGGEIRIWCTRRNELLHTLPQTDGTLTAAFAATPAGLWLCTGGGGSACPHMGLPVRGVRRIT